MGVIHYLNDKLVNLVANLGTARDKSSANQFGHVFITDEELVAAYRGSWMARKIVDIPAFDCTRKWRGWQASKDQIQAIEAEEKRLNVKAKVKDAMRKGRLFGGAAIFIGTGDRDLRLPLDPARIAKGGVKYLNVMRRRQLTVKEIETDPQSPLFDKPKAYLLADTNVEVHPSRLVIFLGAESADDELGLVANEKGWSDSVLLACKEAIFQAESVNANVASLVFEAKVDVLGIPDFAENMENGGAAYEKAVLSRLNLAAMGKGINGMIVRDANETYEQKTASFGTLPDLMDRYDQKVCGSADIPATRFMSQSPAGMSATGESDTRNYYDRIQSMQELELSPAIAILDECIIRSALGSRPAEIYYEWRPLWQPTATEKATIGKTVADTISVLSSSGLFNADALSKAATTTLVEGNVLPGLEAAIEEFGTEIDPEEPDTTPDMGDPEDNTNA